MKLIDKGFTLIEVLIVVLIIGVLVAVAVPQYQKAVLKSRFSSLLPTTKAVRDGNEAHYLTYSGYARLLSELEVTATNNEDITLELSDDPDYTYVLATRSDLGEKNNLIMYQKHSFQYPDEIHCEALDGDTQANWLCETGMHSVKSLGEVITPGFNTYVIEGTGNGLTPSQLEALNGPNCDKASTLGYTCSMVDNGDGTKTKMTCNIDGLCSIGEYNEDGMYKRSTCLKDANGVCQVKKERFYDENGNMTSFRSCSYFNTTTGKCSSYGNWWQDNYDAIYDKDGNKIAELFCNGVNASTGKCTSYYTEANVYTYDENGNVTSKQRCNDINTTTGECSSYYTNLAGANYFYTYDENGNRLTNMGCVVDSAGKCTLYDAQNSFNYTYDSNGNMTSQVRCKTINTTTGVCTSYSNERTEYSYDNQGNLVSSITCTDVNSGTGQCNSYPSNNSVYTYDDGGIQTIYSCTQQDGDGNCTSYNGYNYTVYDEDGNKLWYGNFCDRYSDRISCIQLGCSYYN